MEKILKQLTDEFKDVKENNFITLFSILELIINHSQSKINIQLLTNKISDYIEIENICGYGFLGSKDDFYEKKYNNLNKDINIYNALNFITTAINIEKKRNLFLRSDIFHVIIDFVEGGGVLFVKLNSKNIYALISIILAEFNKINFQLSELKEKVHEIDISSFNYFTSMVKGTSYQFLINNFYINKFKKEIIKVNVYSEYARDTTYNEYFDIEINTLIELTESSDNKFEFYENLKKNQINEIERLKFTNDITIT